jgi:serine/threonine protein kinase
LAACRGVYAALRKQNWSRISDRPIFEDAMDRKRIIKALSTAKIKADNTRTIFGVAEELGQGGNGAAFVVKSSKKEFVAKFYIPPDSRDLDQAAFKRFEREMELAAQVKHPYVVPSEGVGRVQIGSYQIPFYLMRRATGTLRDLVPGSFALPDLSKLLRVYTRVLQGVSYLHHLGIVHRDLKPENVLLYNNTPKIADLGIAHAGPGFVNWSQLTVPKEQLMNRDYYAPEQRHGDATKVDHRADIYALGCILYEIISGISPTRPNLPPLAEFHKDLAPLDKVLNKMIAHAPESRYQNIDLAFDDLLWALVHTGIPTVGPSNDEDDKRDLIRLLSSANAANQAKAIEPAMRLGTKALPTLHEQIGHRRLDVAVGAFRLLGEIAHESSIPYLTAGLYPSHRGKDLRFTTGQYASLALRKYPAEVRLSVLDSINDQVNPEDIARMIDDLKPSESFARLHKLYKENKFYSRWGTDAGLSLLLRIDEDKSWPIIEDMMSKSDKFYTFWVFPDIYPHVNRQRQQEIIDHYLDNPQSLSSFEFPKILEAVVSGSFSKEYVLATLNRISEVAKIVLKRYDEREEFERKLNLAKTQFGL